MSDDPRRNYTAPAIILRNQATERELRYLSSCVRELSGESFRFNLFMPIPRNGTLCFLESKKFQSVRNFWDFCVILRLMI